MITIRSLRSDRGIALVAVLVIIVLATIIVVAFTTRSRNSSTASTSFSSGVSANLLANDAASTVIAGLQREMETNSTVPASSVWLPKAPSDYLPRIDGDSPFSNLLKTGTSMPGGAGPDWLSNVTTDQKSLNGRFFTRDRWNAAALLTNTQATSTALPLPKWFYVDRARNSGALGSGWSKAQFDPIGRYAFRVYDISGLLDINVAGLPQSVSTDTAGQKSIARKGSLAWLDLARASLSGLNNNYALFDWRGPTENYSFYATQFGQPLGFLVSPAATLSAPSGTQTYAMGKVNRFLSRQDLIHATKAQLLAGQFTGDGSDFLTQATVFSREVNAPSTTVLNQAGGTPLASDLRNVATPGADFNAFFPSVTVPAGHTFTRRDGTLAREGEPLVRNRFPLSKIALFTIYQSSVSTAQQKSDALAGIQKFFGLKPNTDGTWRYVHGRVEDASLDPTPNDPKRERLKTLAEIASGNPGSFSFDPQDPADNQAREPDFFEYLQAGILGDSLGQGANAGAAPNEWSDTNIARHILQIGANIIDQYDEDSDPTVIARTPLLDITATATARSRPDPDISGVENVPYIQVIGESFFRRFDSTPFSYLDHDSVPAASTPAYPKIAMYYQFQLWNPHRDAPAASGDFRIVAVGDPYVHLIPQNAAKIPYTADSLTVDIPASPVVHFDPSTHWIGFSVPQTGTFATPHLLKSNDAALGLAQPQFSYEGGASHIVGFWGGDIDAPYNGITPYDPALNKYDEKIVHPEIPAQLTRYSTGANGATLAVDKTTGVSFQLQKKRADGKWLPVQTIAAINRQVVDVLSSLMTDNGKGYSYDFNSKPFLYVHFAWSDPRTLHLGAGFSQIYTGDVAPVDVMLPPTNHFAIPNPGWLATNYGNAPEMAGALVRYYRLALLSGNSPSGSWYADRGVTGPRLGDTAINGSGAEPYATANSRPIILNRAFQSVAELGYAFRDLPWKSLNFSQDLAAKGKSPADAALLDLFSLSDVPVRAGVLNLNAASDDVLRALLRGLALQPGTSLPDLTALSDAEASSVASEIRTYLGSRTAPKNVLRTAADLPAMIQVLPSTASWPKAKREALIAALGDIHNGRTWNVLIDIVAQTGRFPRDDGKREDFQVTGEQHLLVHAAIDRITGKLIDQQSEATSE